MSNIKKFKDRKGNSTAHLYRDVVNQIFYAVLRVGKSIEKQSLETTDHLEALRLLPNALVELGKPKDERLKKAIGEKLLKDYWADLRKEKVAKEVRASTLLKIDSIWANRLEPYFGDWRPDRVKPDIVTDFILWHRAEFKNVQLFNTFKYANNLFQNLVKVGAIEPSQLPVFELPKSEKRHHEKKKGRVVTSQERKNIRSHGSNRIRLIVGLGDILGMRKMEIGALEKSRIVAEDGRRLIYLEEDDTKTGLPRVLVVPKSLESVLDEQIEASGQSAFLFPTKDGKSHLPSQMIDKEWAAVKEAAEIVGRLRFHDLRHSRATEFARQNVNPAIACTILGMSLRMYQKVYLNLTGKDLRKTIDEIDQGVTA